MRRFSWWVVAWIAILLIASPFAARAQEQVFPLPAPLYILTSEQMVIRVDPAHGGQTEVSPPEQPVADFDIAPDGAWYVYRTAANNAVIVTQLAGQNGYVLEFTDAPPPASSAAQTIAWSPDAARIAYLVPQGVRVAEIGAGEFGSPLFSTIQGAWAELYWSAPDTLIASDATGRTTRISGSAGAWTVELMSGVPVRPQPPVPSFLTAQGVMLSNTVSVPGTAGALAFDWGPPAPPPVRGLALPADLYYLAPDAAGVAQVWRLPASGEPARAVTAEAEPVIGYGAAPGGDSIAFVTAGRLFAARLDGTGRYELARLEIGPQRPHPAWSPDGAQIAYHDQRGVWTVPADGSQPPRLAASSRFSGEGIAPGDVRVYFAPRWSADGARLLVSAGFYEGSALAVLDLASGAVIDLPGSTMRGSWARDGRVASWSAYWGYETPGLYLFDPAVPDAPPLTLLDARHAVRDVAQDAAGAWYALVAATPEMGPQFLRVWTAPAADQPFAPLYSDTLAGGFAEMPQIVLPATPGAPPMAAGLRGATFDETGSASGALVIVDMRSGATVQVETSGPVREVQWGR